MWVVKCDGCGKMSEPMMVNGKHAKPKDWFSANVLSKQTGNVENFLDACSAECCSEIDKKARESVNPK